VIATSTKVVLERVASYTDTATLDFVLTALLLDEKIITSVLMFSGTLLDRGHKTLSTGATCSQLHLKVRPVAAPLNPY
jgi:hypothetical protein